MNAATFILVIIGVYLAFRAGSKMRHNKLAWADARATKAKWEGLRELRWVTFRAAVFGVTLLVIYLIAAANMSLHNRHPHKVPAKVGHSSTPSPRPSAVARTSRPAIET